MDNPAYIIIVTYNAMPWIDRCLESCKPYRIIIVDNNSNDGTVAFIKSHFPEIPMLQQTKNLGFGQANNIGIKQALEQGAEYVFLLNQDAYLEKGAIEKLIEIHKSNNDYGILSPIHLNGKGNRLDQNFSNYVTYRNNPDFYSDFVLGNTLNKVYEVPFVNAAGWLLSKSIFDIVGGFDPLFFHYGEDDNYCQRVHFHGFRIGVVPNIFLRHDRENRATPQTKTGSDTYFERMERTLKTKYANINLDAITEFEKLLVKRKKNKWKAFLKMNFSQCNYLKKEIALLTKLKPEILRSRQINKQQGRHYLNS